MKIKKFRGDLTDISAEKEALFTSYIGHQFRMAAIGWHLAVIYSSSETAECVNGRAAYLSAQGVLAGTSKLLNCGNATGLKLLGKRVAHSRKCLHIQARQKHVHLLHSASVSKLKINVFLDTLIHKIIFSDYQNKYFPG